MAADARITTAQGNPDFSNYALAPSSNGHDVFKKVFDLFGDPSDKSYQFRKEQLLNKGIPSILELYGEDEIKSISMATRIKYLLESQSYFLDVIAPIKETMTGKISWYTLKNNHMPYRKQPLYTAAPTTTMSMEKRESYTERYALAATMPVQSIMDNRGAFYLANAVAVLATEAAASMTAQGQYEMVRAGIVRRYERSSATGTGQEFVDTQAQLVIEKKWFLAAAKSGITFSKLVNEHRKDDPSLNILVVPPGLTDFVGSPEESKLIDSYIETLEKPIRGGLTDNGVTKETEVLRTVIQRGPYNVKRDAGGNLLLFTLADWPVDGDQDNMQNPLFSYHTSSELYNPDPMEFIKSKMSWTPQAGTVLIWSHNDGMHKPITSEDMLEHAQIFAGNTKVPGQDYTDHVNRLLEELNRNAETRNKPPMGHTSSGRNITERNLHTNGYIEFYNDSNTREATSRDQFLFTVWDSQRDEWVLPTHLGGLELYHRNHAMVQQTVNSAATFVSQNTMGGESVFAAAFAELKTIVERIMRVDYSHEFFERLLEANYDNIVVQDDAGSVYLQGELTPEDLARKWGQLSILEFRGNAHGSLRLPAQPRNGAKVDPWNLPGWWGAANLRTLADAQNDSLSPYQESGKRVAAVLAVIDPFLAKIQECYPDNEVTNPDNRPPNYHHPDPLETLIATLWPHRPLFLAVPNAAGTKGNAVAYTEGSDKAADISKQKPVPWRVIELYQPGASVNMFDRLLQALSDPSAGESTAALKDMLRIRLSTGANITVPAFILDPAWQSQSNSAPWFKLWPVLSTGAVAAMGAIIDGFEAAQGAGLPAQAQADNAKKLDRFIRLLNGMIGTDISDENLQKKIQTKGFTDKALYPGVIISSVVISVAKKGPAWANISSEMDKYDQSSQRTRKATLVAIEAALDTINVSDIGQLNVPNRIPQDVLQYLIPKKSNFQNIPPLSQIQKDINDILESAEVLKIRDVDIGTIIIEGSLGNDVKWQNEAGETDDVIEKNKRRAIARAASERINRLKVIYQGNQAEGADEDQLPGIAAINPDLPLFGEPVGGSATPILAPRFDAEAYVRAVWVRAPLKCSREMLNGISRDPRALAKPSDPNSNHQDPILNLGATLDRKIQDHPDFVKVGGNLKQMAAASGAAGRNNSFARVEGRFATNAVTYEHQSQPIAQVAMDKVGSRQKQQPQRQQQQQRGGTLFNFEETSSSSSGMGFERVGPRTKKQGTEAEYDQQTGFFREPTTAWDQNILQRPREHAKEADVHRPAQLTMPDAINYFKPAENFSSRVRDAFERYEKAPHILALTLCDIFTPLTGDAMRGVVRHLFPPFNLGVIRHITLRTMGMLLTKPGAMTTYAQPPHARIAQNNIPGWLWIQSELQFAHVVNDPDSIRLQPNVAPAGVISGWETSFYRGPEDVMKPPRERPSLIAVAWPLQEQLLTPFLWNGAPLNQDLMPNQSQGRTSGHKWSSYRFYAHIVYNAITRFIGRVEGEARSSAAKILWMQRIFSNVIHRGFTIRVSPASGQLKRRIAGNGPLGELQMNTKGAEQVFNGEKTKFPEVALAEVDDI